MSSRDIYTPNKVAKSGQKWPKVAKSGQKWPEVAKSDQKWPEVAKSGQKWPKSGQKWPEFSEESRNPSFRLEKSLRDASKTFLSLAGSWTRIVHTMFNTVFFSSGFFCLKTVWNGHFGQLIDEFAWKRNSEPFWTVSDRVGYTVLVGLKIDPWRRYSTVDTSCFPSIVGLTRIPIRKPSWNSSMTFWPCQTSGSWRIGKWSSGCAIPRRWARFHSSSRGNATIRPIFANSWIRRANCPTTATWRQRKSKAIVTWVNFTIREYISTHPRKKPTKLWNFFHFFNFFHTLL